MESFELVLLTGLGAVVLYCGIDTWNELKPIHVMCAGFIHKKARRLQVGFHTILHTIEKHLHLSNYNLSTAYCFNANRIHSAHYVRSIRHTT